MILRGHKGDGVGVAFSPDGREVASTGRMDHTLKVWDLTTKGEPVVLRGHAAAVWTALSGPDGQHMATASNDGTDPSPALGTHHRPLLSDADRVLVTLVYLRGVCPQKALADLLGTNPVTIGEAVRETRPLLDEHKIAVPQSTHYFSRVQDLRQWLEQGEVTEQTHLSQALSHSELTGMPREAFHDLLQRLAVPYQAVIEQRRHRRRGGAPRPGSRRGVFTQKITDADRILATVLAGRQQCDQQSLADLFGISRGTIRNAIDDVQPLLDQHGYWVTPSARRFNTADDVLTFARAHADESPP